MIGDNRFYVYEVVVDGVRRYIGKGTGRRLRAHLQIAQKINERRAAGENCKATLFYNKLAKALRHGSRVDTLIIEDGLSESDAFAREIELIASSPDDVLWNMLAGGDSAGSADMKRAWLNPELREKFLAAQERNRADPAWQHKVSVGLKAAWNKLSEEQRRERRSRVEAFNKSDEGRELFRQLTSARHADPITSDRMKAGLKKVHASQELTEKMITARSAGMKASSRFRAVRIEVNQRPALRARRSAKLKAFLSDPVEHAKRVGQLRTMQSDPVVQAKKSTSLKIANRRKEVIERRSEAGKTFMTDERRAHLSATNKGKPWSEARRAAQTNLPAVSRRKTRLMKRLKAT